jgi:hypothetical protein
MYKLMERLLRAKTSGKAVLYLLPALLLGQVLQTEGDNLVLTFRPATDGAGPGVTLTAKGKLVSPTSSDPATERQRKFVAALTEANASGVPGRILALWRDSEKLDIERKLADPKMTEANRNLYSQIKTTELLAYIEYGSYQLLFVRHDGTGSGIMIRTYPVIESGGRLYLTNALREDTVFANLSTIYERELRKLPARRN